MLPLAIKILALAMMVRLLVAMDKPWLSAGIYGIVALALDLVFEGATNRVLLMGGIRFIGFIGYFWVLDKIDEGSGLWWVIAAIGVPLVFL